MPKIIVLSGHGAWALGKDEFVQLPGNCSIKFYTMNMRLLSDGHGGNIDRGIVAGLEPDQVAGPFKSVPDMRLYPPTGLNIRRPNPAQWRVVDLPALVPVDDKNLQVRIDNRYPGGASLSTILKRLEAAINYADSVTILWAACREIGLQDRGGSVIGINTVQR